MSAQAQSSRIKAARVAEAGAKAYGESDFSQAELWFGQAAALDPAIPSYRCNLATARLALGKTELACRELEKSIDPLEALDCATLGLALTNLKAAKEAMVWLKRALLLDPGQVAARINLANLMTASGQHEDAIMLMRQGLAESPDHWPLLNNLGLALQEAGRLQETLEMLARAQTLAPGQPDILLNLAHALLLSGRWREGFAAYEARPLPPSPSQAPLWNGGQQLGKTLLVRAEQGFGDAIHFARFLPLAQALVGSLILSCDKTLLRLMAGMCNAVDEALPLPAHDLQSALLSLPRLLGLDAPELFAPTPYIKPPPPPKLAGAFKVGLVWAGRRGHANDKNRSLDPVLLAPLLGMAGISFYALQIGRGAPPAGMTDLAPGIADLADTASALAGLDLLISADTAPAHLAGAMGKPVWTLIPFAPDWRWGLTGEATPWYPSMRLFRQDKPGDWAGVIERVATALRIAADSGNPNPSPSSV
ncbi:MAG: tetratricopeptide repeat protein [Rhodospirillales bacterium]